MSPVQPGEVRRALRPEPARARRPARLRAPEARRGHPSRHHPLEPPAVLRLLPRELHAALRPGRPGRRRARRPGHELADEPRRHRARGGGDGLAPAAGRPVRRPSPASSRTRPAPPRLVALLCARERTTGHGQVRGGLQARAAPLAVYASEQAHSSIDKAALLAGFGRENLRLLPTDEAHALRPRRARGRAPPRRRRRQAPLRRRRHGRHHRHHRARPRGRASASSPAHTGPGSTSTPPSPAPPWPVPSCAGCGTASTRPTRSS